MSVRGTLFLFSLVVFLNETVLAAPPVTSKECREWFRSTGISASKDINCISKCEGRVDSAVLLSFVCAVQCSGLCGYDAKNEEKQYFLKALQNVTVYYGLNQHELKLSLDDPKAAYLIYKSKNLAEKLAETLLRRNDRLDESDAVRHAAWALYSCLFVGAEKAKKFLTAHEMSDESVEGRSMDIANNNLGFQACKKIYRPNERHQDVERGMAEIISLYEKDKLVVMRPRKKRKKSE